MTREFAFLLSFVSLSGVGALAWATEGFQVITTQGARAVSIARHPIPVPNVRLFDQDGREFTFADYRGQTILVNFIYARCPRICGVIGNDFQSTLSLPVAKGDHASFLSVSFDRADDREALQYYANRYDAKPPRWRVAAPSDSRGLATLLRTFGVTVIPDGLGGFVHDGTIYLVNSGGYLSRIMDSGEWIPTARP